MLPIKAPHFLPELTRAGNQGNSFSAPVAYPVGLIIPKLRSQNVDIITGVVIICGVCGPAFFKSGHAKKTFAWPESFREVTRGSLLRAASPSPLAYPLPNKNPQVPRSQDRPHLANTGPEGI